MISWAWVFVCAKIIRDLAPVATWYGLINNPLEIFRMSENMDKNNEIENKNYSAIISSLRSPMSVFGLAMLICNAVFSTSAAIMGDLDAFTYSIHTFLAIVFLFVIIAVWSPRTLYHPVDLKDLEKELPEIKHSREIITLIMLLAGSAYAGYQLSKSTTSRENEKTVYNMKCLAPKSATPSENEERVYNMECSATLAKPKSETPSENEKTVYKMQCSAPMAEPMSETSSENEKTVYKMECSAPTAEPLKKS
jgi:hypothetical protein